MKNLFIMHTQYNLIIACSLVKYKYFESENDLILNAEFDLKENYKKILEKIFNNVWYSQEEYYKKNNIFSEINLYKKIYQSKNYIHKQRYDNIIISQEQYFDTMILTKLSDYNKFNLYNIEEDIYYSYDNSNNNLNIQEFMKRENNLKRKCQSIVRRILFGKNKYFQPHYFYGMNSNYDEYFCLFPNAVRKELKGKIMNEITLDMVCEGVNTLYTQQRNLCFNENKYIVIFFDLLERYKDIDIIEKVSKRILELAKTKNIKVIYKYHPRENQYIECIHDNNDAIKIDSNIPSEEVLVKLINKDITVIGNSSSALLLSAKLGNRTLSTASICSIDNISIINAYQKMGIYSISDLEDIDI